MKKRIIELFRHMPLDQTFVIDNVSGREISYATFFSTALSIADMIDDRVSEDTIIAIKENSLDLALLYFATIFTQKRIAVIDPQKGEEEISGLLKEIKSTGVFTDIPQVIRHSSDHFVLADLPLDEEVDERSLAYRMIDKLEARDMDAPYLITYTSGTSGVTKGVTHSIKNLFMTAYALDERIGKRGGCFLHVMPMTYMAGVLNSLIYPFVTDNKIVIDKRFSITTARCFWDTVIKYNVDLFWLSPSMLTMIEQLDRKTSGEEYCRGATPVFLIGTAPLSNDLRDRFNNRYGVKVYASYGLSETLFVSVETATSMEKSEKNSVGELLQGVKYEILDNGEMLIDVPWMFLGYTNVDTREYFSENYYKTGDLVEIRDGCLYVTGRSKDLIIKGGMNISPVLIENVINDNPKILENAVVGVKDNKGEEKICCAYVLNDVIEDIKGFESSVKKSVIEKLGKNYSIDYMLEIEGLPRNINGKTDRKRIASIWENRNNAI